jgi:hypothetical protein
MNLKTALTSNLTNKMVKRFNPSWIYGAPPVQYIPTLSSKANKIGRMESDEVQQVKIAISSKVSKYYDVFKEGNTEEVIMLIWTNEGIMANKKLIDQINVIDELMYKKRTCYTKPMHQTTRSNEGKKRSKTLRWASRS